MTENDGCRTRREAETGCALYWLAAWAAGMFCGWVFVKGLPMMWARILLLWMTLGMCVPLVVARLYVVQETKVFVILIAVGLAIVTVSVAFIWSMGWLA